MKIEKNDDLIRRSRLFQELEHDLGCFDIENVVKSHATLYADLGDIVRMLLAAPKADAVEVVRCKYCLYRSQYCNDEGLYGCGSHDGELHAEDYFCADGERR